MNTIKLLFLSFLDKLKSIIFNSNKHTINNISSTENQYLSNTTNNKETLSTTKNDTSSINIYNQAISQSPFNIKPSTTSITKHSTILFPNKIEIPKIISVSLISLNKLDSNSNLLKLIIYLDCRIKLTNSSDFIVLINNTLIKTTTATIVNYIEYNLIELTTAIPNYINSAYISILLGSPNEEELTTRSFSNNPLKNIFPYIKCSVVNPLTFRWLLDSKSFISKVDDISYYHNTFIYKLPTPISFDNFERRFDYSPEAKSSILNLDYNLNIDFGNLSSIEIKIINNSVPLKYSNLGSIYILFYPTKSNIDYSYGFFTYNKINVYLENNNCEIHFKLDLPTVFIDNISLIQSYYLPTEYLLTTYENTIFVNSSYKSITTKFESYH